VKVIDFGIAKFALGETQTRITQSSGYFGTPQYSSPEQFECSRDVDLRSDLFSIGSILFEMLTGEAPFRGDSLAELCFQIVSGDPKSPKAIYPAFPAQAEPFLMRALAKKPEDRFQNASEMLKALKSLTTPRQPKQWLATVPTELQGAARYSTGQQVSASKSTLRPFGRLSLVLGVSGLVLALSAVAIFVWWGGSSKPPADRRFSISRSASPVSVSSERGLPVSRNSNTTTSSAQASVESLVPQVRITVEGAPQGAAIYFRDASVEGNPFVVNKSATAEILRVEAKGYRLSTAM
jgi:serine/threonine protein kinase